MPQGRGTVITGRIEQGVVKVGEDVELVGMQGVPTKTVVTGAPTHLLAIVCLFSSNHTKSTRKDRVFQAVM